MPQAKTAFPNNDTKWWHRLIDNFGATWLGSKAWTLPHWRILYYHGVDEIQRDRFREQLEWFSTQFRWCSMSEGLRAITVGPCDKPLMSLTFDDADETVHRVVLPVLAELKIPACVYVVPAYVVHGMSFRDSQPRKTMTWNQLSEWLAAGNEVGSHTHTHANMPCCNRERMIQELRWSKESIEETLGIDVLHFAYPWGQYSQGTRSQIDELGCYETAATTHRGQMRFGHDPLSLRRDRVNLADSGQNLERLMRLADHYYWLRRFRWQSLRRVVGAQRVIPWRALRSPLVTPDDVMPIDSATSSLLPNHPTNHQVRH